MQLISTRTKARKLAIAGVAAAFTVGSALVAAPASAESAAMIFVCNTPVGDKEFITVADTDLPATMVAGTTVPVTSTAKVTIPADLSELAYSFLGARSVDGTTVVKSSIDDAAPTETNKTVASTPVPATGPLTITAVGTAAPYTATVGTHVIKAVSYTASLSFKREDGTEAIKVDTTCNPKTVNGDGTAFNQDLTVDTVTVTPAPPTTTPAPAPAKSDTTTKVTAKFAKAAKKAKVKVVVKAASGEATGKVKVILKKGPKKVQKVTSSLKSGKAKVVFKKIKAKGKYKVIAKYVGSETTNKSSGKAGFKVA